MNRAQYIEYRKAGLMGEVAYAYYLEKQPNPYPRDFFKKAFPLFAQSRRDIDWQLMWRYFDIKFDVRILTDTKDNNKIIMIF
ncbi:MAG: hypothetical protein PQJ49_01850 [Sphaerochaetaceae bacterium]|nr:hypothetical protein [Sphaerochaetaceae bacterium]